MPAQQVSLQHADMLPHRRLPDSRPASTVSQRVVEQVISDLGLPVLAGILLGACFTQSRCEILAWIALVPFAATIARKRGSLDLYIGTYFGGLFFGLCALDFVRTLESGTGCFDSHVCDWLALSFTWATTWPVTLYIGRLLLLRQRFLPMAIVLPLAWVSNEFMAEGLGWICLWSPFPW